MLTLWTYVYIYVRTCRLYLRSTCPSQYENMHVPDPYHHGSFVQEDVTWTATTTTASGSKKRERSFVPDKFETFFEFLHKSCSKPCSVYVLFHFISFGYTYLSRSIHHACEQASALFSPFQMLCVCVTDLPLARLRKDHLNSHSST